MDPVGFFIVHGVAFGRTVLGLISRPYETYRRIVDYGRPGELVYIALLMVLYFALASLVKVADFRPFLLTKQFVLLVLGAGSGACVSVLCIWVAGKLLGVKSRLAMLSVAWGYTMLPTVTWFFVTSLLYILIPPPRTTSVLGITFSILFLTFSATLLWWKITMAYLTIRFGLKISFGKALIVASVCAPVLTAWCYGMYKAGIFKVPFL